MIVEVDISSPIPAYEQIRAQIARMILAGVLAPGTRLPTIRQLASDLSLAKGTVAKAYEALLRDGVVEAAGRRGTVVSAHGHAAAGGDTTAALRDAARDLALTARQLGADEGTAVQAVRDALAELTAGRDGVEPSARG